MPVDLPTDTSAIRLAVAMARRGLTGRKLADLLGVHHTAISRLLSRGIQYGGKTSPANIAAVLGVPVEALEPGGPWAPLFGAE